MIEGLLYRRYPFHLQCILKQGCVINGLSQYLKTGYGSQTPTSTAKGWILLLLRTRDRYSNDPAINVRLQLYVKSINQPASKTTDILIIASRWDSVSWLPVGHQDLPVRPRHLRESHQMVTCDDTVFFLASDWLDHSFGTHILNYFAHSRYSDRTSTFWSIYE